MPPAPLTTNLSRSRLNWLRAAVLGANDGIISLSGLVIGVASATSSRTIILAAGIAGLIAGAFSMAAGEFVSVSTQRDSEKALLDKERRELSDMPVEELEELVGLYERKGLTRATASLVASELTARDAYAAHIDIELGLDPNDLTSPWQATIASAASFVAGAIIPFAVILMVPERWRIVGTFNAVVIALLITALLSAKLSNTPPVRASMRIVLGGILAMLVTHGVGTLFHVSGL